MTAPSLDRLLVRAREVELRPEPRAQCVADAQRLARLAPEPRRWWVIPALAVGAAAAAGLVGAVLFSRPASPRAVAGEPVWVGDRVAVIPEAAASYRVVGADDAHTTIEVARGAVTARLLPGAAPHALVLRGGGIEATATGTVYTLEVDADGGARMRVHEGTVRVDDLRIHHVHAGAMWSRPAGADEGHASLGSGPLGKRAASTLLALAPIAPAPSVPPPAPPPPAIVDAPDVVEAPPPAAGTARPPRPDPVDDTPEARWRRARLLRGQGKADEARTLLLAISDDGDATWAPLAHIEAIRIDLEDRAAPEHALALADRMLARWPTHALVTEVRALRCRALGLLGRGAECDRAKP